MDDTQTKTLRSGNNQNHNIQHNNANDLEQIVRIIRLQNKASENIKKGSRQVTILKEEYAPYVNLALSDALDAFVEGEYIYFLFPGQILKYNITYNIFEQNVKIAESKILFI